jgi:threonine synthase
MKYYSTNKRTPLASLKKAVIKGVAGDNGLYMPENIDLLKEVVVGKMRDMSFKELSCVIAETLFGGDIPNNALEQIVNDALDFDVPIVHLHDNIYALELFHGPTMSFKDISTRFMARLLKYFIEKEGIRDVTVLTATTGDTGIAVADAFSGIDDIRTYILYPKGRISPLQEARMTAGADNVMAVEIDGDLRDCQSLVRSAFMDEELNTHKRLTSANSINIARLLPQTFFYFYAYAQLDKMNKTDELVISIPSSHLGNLTAGLIAYWMGLPVKRFLTAGDKKNTFSQYLATGVYTAPASNTEGTDHTSNMSRILDLFSIYPDPYTAIRKRIVGYSYSFDDIACAITEAHGRCRYILDPYSACAYKALLDNGLSSAETGLMLATAHPAGQKETVDEILSADIEIPESLLRFTEKGKRSISLPNDFAAFKQYLSA